MSAKGSAGSYGTYLRVSPKRGLKILRRGYSSLAALRRSQEWTAAEQEVTLLREAAAVGLAPKYAHRTHIVHQRKYHAAISMEHLAGVQLCNVKSIKQLTKILRDWLASKTGIVNNDLVPRHVFFDGQRFRVIDFTPDWCERVSKGKR